MSDEEKLMWLRLQLFSAMQTLKGELLAEFWQLIDDVTECREIYQP